MQDWHAAGIIPKKTINDKGVRIDHEIQDLLEIEQIVGKRV